MDPYTYVVIVSALALMAYYFTLLMGGLARGLFKIAPPSHSRPEEYEHFVRARHNPLEHMVLFQPGMWLFAYTVGPYWAAGNGTLWPPMRVLYALVSQGRRHTPAAACLYLCDRFADWWRDAIDEGEMSDGRL